MFVTTPSVSMRSVHYLDVRQRPALVEVGLQRPVESEGRESRQLFSKPLGAVDAGVALIA